MGLARVKSRLSDVLIRRYTPSTGDQTGGPKRADVEAELDNLIGWAKISPRRIKFDTSIVGNVGAGLDVLHTFSLPANSLQTNGDELDVVYGGSLASNDTNKRVNAFFDSTAYENGGTLDIDAGAWEIRARIIRLTSTSVRTLHTLRYFGVHIDSTNAVNAFGGGFFSITRLADFSTANLNSNAVTMEVKGEGAANDDVRQFYSSIYLTQQ